MLLLGYDLGSSFIKASVIDSQSGEVIAAAQAPETEMLISSPKPGWAEQNPEMWWGTLVKVTNKLSEQIKGGLDDICALGISYQMHGLVLVDSQMQVIRPSIIWCDGRAVSIGNEAAKKLGNEECLKRFRNLPGNFTASKLKWVKENEPHNYQKIHKIVLPGDFIAMKMSGICTTSYSGLSEGIFWDYNEESVAHTLLDFYGISSDLLPSVVPNFGYQGELTRAAASVLGLKSGIPITYRAGDQPNNALSLNAIQPGETAITAGTSGAVFCVIDKELYDIYSRVNTFLHVNHTPQHHRYGILLCISGAGSCNSWIKKNFADSNGAAFSYTAMDKSASMISPGSDGLYMIPFGNGPERILENIDTCASFHGLRFPTHSAGHCARAAQEGIAFAFNYGIEILDEIGCGIQKFRAGNANMFKSAVFTETLTSVSNKSVELFDTDGSQGAARGAGIGAGIYSSAQEAFKAVKPIGVIEPESKKVNQYKDIYQQWKQLCNNVLRGK